MSNQETPALDGVHIHFENKKTSYHFFIFIWVMYAMVYMTKNCFSAAMASIVAEGVLTKIQTGNLTSIFYLVYSPLQILGGIFADKYNPEKMVKIGLVGSAIANAVIFINQNYYVMLVSWTFNAIVQFALWPAVFKIMSSQLCRSERKKMAFYMSFAAPSGLIMAYFAAAFIMKWEYNFALSAVILAVFAIALHFYYKKLEPTMKPDKPNEAPVNAKNSQPRKKMSTIKLFTLSGFFIMCIVTLLRFTVEQGFKTLTPTMLMETYENVSPRIGNLMSIIVIIVGMAGTLISRAIYPKLIRNELMGYFIPMLIALPLVYLVTHIGNIPFIVAVSSISVIVLLLSVTILFSSFYNMSFVKYGKDGTAAGINNAIASLGVVVYSSGFSAVADNSNWTTVMNLSLVMITSACVLTLIAFFMWRRFKKREY